MTLGKNYRTFHHELRGNFQKPETTIFCVVIYDYIFKKYHLE